MKVYGNSLSRCVRMALLIVAMLVPALAIGTPGLNSPADLTTPVSAQDGAGWTGNWQSSGQPFGDLTIIQNGNQLTGVFSTVGLYKNFSATITGNYSGKVAGEPWTGTVCMGKLQERSSGIFVDGWTLVLTYKNHKDGELLFNWGTVPTGGGWTWHRGGPGAGTDTGTGTGTGTGISTGVVSGSAAPGNVTLQPGPGLNNGTDDGSATKGKDTWVNNLSPISPGGGVFYLWNISCNQYRGRGLLRFSLDGLPNQNVTSAKVYMYTSVYFNGSGSPWPAGDQKVSVRKVTSDWNEKTVSWDNPPGFDPAVIDPKVVRTTGVKPPAKEFQDWLSFDITDLYKGWANGSIPNHGIMFYLDTSVCQNGDEFTMYTSDWADSSLRPKLVVTVASSGNGGVGGNSGGGATGPVNPNSSTGSTAQGSACGNNGWVGRWQSSEWHKSFMDLTQSGNQVTGSYLWGTGHEVSGTISGNKFIGKWIGQNDHTFELTLAPDGQSMTGRYKGMSASDVWQPITFTCYGTGTGSGTGTSNAPSTSTGTGASNAPSTGAGTTTGAGWGGSWASGTSGKMNLVQSGNQVTGDYTNTGDGRNQGKITGTVSGNNFTGTWSEPPTYKPYRDAGPLQLTLAPDGQTMTGSWQYETSTSWGSWGGTYTRTGAGTGTGTGTGTTSAKGTGTTTGMGAALTAESRTADPNSTVQVPIRLDRAASIGSMNFILTYNAQVLKVNKVDGGSLISGALFTPNFKTPPQVRFGLAGSDGINGSGPVAYIEFQVIGAAGTSSPLTLSEVDTTDTSGKAVTVTTQNGTVTVASATGSGNIPDVDGDGKVTELDALTALKMSVKLLGEKLKLDVDKNGKVTAEDARLILKMAVGK